MRVLVFVSCAMSIHPSIDRVVCPFFAWPAAAHYTPAFVAAHRRRSLFTPAARISSKSQNWITHRPAALCSCHSLNPLHASVSKQRPSSSPDFSAEIPPAELVVITNIDIVTGSRMNCRVTTVEGLSKWHWPQFQLTGFSTLNYRSAPSRRSFISTPGHREIVITILPAYP